MEGPHSWLGLSWPHSAAHVTPPCPTQVALVVFAVHTLVAEENAMDAEKAFVTLTVLNILNKAQAFLPFSIHSVVQVRRQGGKVGFQESGRGVRGCARSPPVPVCGGGGERE